MLQTMTSLFSGDLTTNGIILFLVLVGATALSWPISRPLERWVLRRRSDQPQPGERLSWFLHRAGAGFFWPFLGAVLALVGLVLLPGSAPILDRVGVLSAFWFLAVFQVLSASFLAFVQPGPTRRRLRRLVVPAIIMLAVLDHVALLDSILTWLDRPLFTLQETPLSVLSVLTGILIASLFILAAKALGDFLSNRLLPRLGMEQALSDALGSVSRYILVIAGFFVAAENLGFNFTSLKIVLGALSVGIGFGLQNIVNNFVSGLILMFERTIKRGDILQLHGTTGKVLAIGLRSSIIRTRAGHELIVPNGDLIASQVDNMSFKDTLVRVDVPLGVSYHADPHQVRDLMIDMARKHEAVVVDPPPSVNFQAFGESSIDFELRVWVHDVWRLPIIRSDLLYGAWYALKDAEIEIPFPQRDIHIRSGSLAPGPETQ